MSTYFSGQGKVYAAVRSALGVSGGFVDLGNCSALVLHMGLSFAGGATGGSETLSAAVRSGEVPTFTLTMEDFSPSNLATMLYGQANSVGGATATNEAITPVLGASVPLANIGVTSITYVKNPALTTTYALNTDYTVDLVSGMLTFPAGSSCPITGVVVTYVYATHNKVAAGVMAPPFYALRFQGLNTGNTSESVVVDLYKTRIYPVTDIPLIGDNIAQFPMSGRIFRDTNRTATLTDGQYLRIRKL